MDVNEIYLYHITPVENLDSILRLGKIFCDKFMTTLRPGSHVINGMPHIKQRRLYECRLHSYPDLYVGDCVPFYFCPRSVMLFVIAKKNEHVSYKKGEDNIVHLEVKLTSVLKWAQDEKLKWAFTDTNAGSYTFNDYSDIRELKKLDWEIIKSNFWAGPRREYKQAEFLIEDHIDIELFTQIGVKNQKIYNEVKHILEKRQSSLPVTIRKDWYYYD